VSTHAARAARCAARNRIEICSIFEARRAAH
jgi:hypothetical protein